ncbi:MAG: molybdopterin-dependent oxidoreductase [Nitrospirae bacterium]|nr:molybdopterin-dependent oxidoreductase [Nitrospirota bacterium]
MNGMDRREFLAVSAGAAAVLSLQHLGCTTPAPSRTPARGPFAGEPYGDWRDIYGKKWSWDKIVRGTHLMADCIAACAWDLYVRDGVVVREEQNTLYPQTNPDLPDFNPRGCQKGACYSDHMYAPSRIKYPLKRVGPRGSGKWQRISWDEALSEIADKIIDTVNQYGSECVVYDHGTTQIDMGPDTAGGFRVFALMGSTIIDSWAGVGDLPMGVIQTLGLYNMDGTSDDWFNSDYIIAWVGNPAYTRIPEFHFITEARYKGAKVVHISPDLNASAMHADLWVNPRVGTDAALGLGIAHVIVSERLYKEDVIKEQTDLPFLVRSDTGRFLREADVVEGGEETGYYMWDARRQRLAPAPGVEGNPASLGEKPNALDVARSLGAHHFRSIRLRGLDPAIEGRHTVKLKDGSSVEVRPVLELLKERLATYAPERVRAITGVHPDTIRQLAREIAAAKSAMIFMSWGACKHYHSDLFQRAALLVLALTGQFGKPGAGMRVGAWWTIHGFEILSYDVAHLLPPLLRPSLELMAGAPSTVRPTARLMDDMMKVLTRQYSLHTPLIPWLYTHGGLDRTAGRAAYGDPAFPRSVESCAKESMEKDWMPVYPRPGKDPKVFIFSGVNPLRRWPTPSRIREVLWPKLDLIVSINPRMSSSGLQADLVLPAAGWYEKTGIKFTMSYVPYVIAGDQAVAPLYESRREWDIGALLAKRIQERARARGVKPHQDPLGNTHDLNKVYDRFTKKGEMREGEADKAMDYILGHSKSVRGVKWSELRREGATRIKHTGGYMLLNHICGDYEEGKAVYPLQWNRVNKEPYPTMTARQQFYIDHPWYLEAGEALPTHKEPPEAGGKYPLRLTGGHTRWSIHSIQRDQRHMLRLQRGQPAVYMNADDARRRGLRDGDHARLYNDVGSFIAAVKVSPSVQPGQVVCYHAWEPYQFKGRSGNQEVVASPFKALHLAGEYGHLYYRAYYAAPSHTPRGPTLEVEKVATS